jgi:HEAT repeat protein
VAVSDGRIDADEFLDRLTISVDDLSGEALARSLQQVARAQGDAIAEGLATALDRHRDVVLRVLADLDARPGGVALGPLTQGRSLLAPADRKRLDAKVRSAVHQVLPKIVELLGHRDPLVREHAISVYAKLSPPNVRAHLDSALADSSRRVRSQALRAVTLTTQRGVLPASEALALVKRALEADHWREREIAVNVVGRIGGPAAVPLLVEAMQDSNAFVRHAAVKGAARLPRGEVVVRALVRALGDDVPHVRAEACRALAALRAPQGRHAVQALTRDHSAMVRDAAKRALEVLP